VIKSASTGLLLALLIAVVPFAGGAPEPLKIDKSIKPRSSDKDISRVHTPIINPSGSSQMARLRILEAMLKMGPAWLLEDEGDDYILGRWGYRGSLLIYRIEYSDELVQVRLEESWGPLQCTNLQEGICYKAHRSFYKYTRKMLGFIETALAEHGT
jgi:hypothetical protein